METTMMHRKWVRLVLPVWPVIAVINFILPFLIPAIVNRIMRQATGIDGHLKRIKLSFWPAACTIHKFSMDIYARQGQAASLAVETMRLNLEPRYLWKGIISGYMDVDYPEITFTRVYKQPEKKQGPSEPMPAMLPVIIKQLKVTHLRMAYTDLQATPNVELETNNICITAINVTNIAEGEQLPSEIEISGEIYGGFIKGNIKADFTRSQPSFDLDVSVENVNLAMFNDLFAAYAKFTIKKGVLDVFTEVAAKNGSFKGYVKPLIQHLDILGKEDKKQGAIHVVWEALLGTTAYLFENHNKEQIGTKVPFEGEFKDPTIKTWYAIIETLRNAFIHALRPSIDYEININSVK